MKTVSITRSIIFAVLFVVFALGAPFSARADASSAYQSQGPGYQVHLPFVGNQIQRNNDTYEWNDVISDAFGPLDNNTVYKSYLSEDVDLDWYFFDVKTLGMVSVELTNIVSKATDLDVRLYNHLGLPAAISQNNLADELIEFFPNETGRYYVLVYRWGGPNDAGKPYHLKVKYNTQPATTNEIYGHVSAHHEYLPNISVCLNFYDVNLRTTRRYQTITSESGRYQFLGLPSLTEGQFYEPYFFNWYLGPRYAGYVSHEGYDHNDTWPDFGTINITPIDLTGPPSPSTQRFPLTFTWIPRYKISALRWDYYSLYITSIDHYQYWRTGALDHVDGYTQPAIPVGLNYGKPYRWGVFASDGNGGYGYPYYEREVTFADGVKPANGFVETSGYVLNHQLKAAPEFEKSLWTQGENQ